MGSPSRAALSGAGGVSRLSGPLDLGRRPTDEEMDAIVAELLGAGLLTIGTDADGSETRTVTSEGAQVGRQPAMATSGPSAPSSTRLRAGHEKRRAPRGTGLSVPLFAQPIYSGTMWYRPPFEPP
jgi:hypothetical protein